MSFFQIPGLYQGMVTQNGGSVRYNKRMERERYTDLQALSPDERRGYETARENAFYSVLENPGYLRLRGSDRRAYLQRQTTNDLDLLAPYRCLLTILTSPNARILDVLRLFESKDEDLGEEAIDILTLPGRGLRTLDYFRQRIFFMDKVSIEDLSSRSAQVIIDGPRAEEILEGVGFSGPPRPGEWLGGSATGAGWMVLNAGGFAGEGYLVLVPAEGQRALEDRLTALDAVKISRPVYEILRVEAGIPGPDGELTDKYTPFEVGLGHAVSDSKGCYTGQEVLARQVTYDKVTQQVVGLRLEASVEPGDPVLVEGRRSGAVTSAVHSPRFGPIALGVVRRPHHSPGTIVEIGDGEARVTGVVDYLPFPPPKSG